MNIYVSNLSPETTREELLEAFQAHGEVYSISVPAEKMKDGRGFGVGRGYGFVVMPDKVQAQAALGALNLKEIHGRAISVQAATVKRSFRHRG